MPSAGFEDHQRSSDPFGKFSAITDSSTAYQESVLTRSDPICSVLSIELSSFYHAQVASDGSRQTFVAYTPGREGTDLAEPERSKFKLVHAAVSGKRSHRKNRAA